MTKNKEKAKELEKEYIEVLRDFAIYYMAIWNALKALGMTDPQVKGAISHILENSGGTMLDTTKRAKQERRDTWVKFMKECEKRNETN